MMCCEQDLATSSFPCPGQTTADLSAVADSERYKSALQKAGFNILAERNGRDFALAFFADLRAKTAAAAGLPPLGLHILMGRNTPQKVQNMIDNISKGRIAGRIDCAQVLRQLALTGPPSAVRQLRQPLLDIGISSA
jgi:hypothetical protein